jgi:hypothetical protein
MTYLILFLVSEYICNGELFNKIKSFSYELVKFYVAELATALGEFLKDDFFRRKKAILKNGYKKFWSRKVQRTKSVIFGYIVDSLKLLFWRQVLENGQF